MFQVKVVSPKHRLIKVDSQEFGCCKVPLNPVTTQEEPVRTACVRLYFSLAFLLYSFFISFCVLIFSHTRIDFTRSYISSLFVYEMLIVSLSLPTKVIPSAPAASDSDTDYSDPFDVHPDPRGRPNWEPKSASTDCCSYMEPFEAQRIISGLL